MRWLGAGIIALSLVPGCASRSLDLRLEPRLERAEGIASQARLSAFTRTRGDVRIKGYKRLRKPGALLRIYIEGDGLAWVSSRRPSSNPTPIEPLALRLAAIDPDPNVVYLGRPGQYFQRPGPRRYWLEARFAPEVIAAYTEIIKSLADKSDARNLELVGFSGGAAVAALVLARLVDDPGFEQLSLRTIAGNLDHRAWTALHRLSPLTGSLNPADSADKLKAVPQVHYIGTHDRQVPEGVLQGYLKRITRTDCLTVKSLDCPHQGCWDNHWARLLQRSPGCGH
jgi:hypothetical protein